MNTKKLLLNIEDIENMISLGEISSREGELLKKVYCGGEAILTAEEKKMYENI